MLRNYLIFCSKYSLISIFILFFVDVSFAQKAKGKTHKGVLNKEMKANKELNRSTIQAVQKNGFVLYLPTKSKNIEALQKVMDNPNTSDKSKERLLKQQQKIQEATKKRNKALQEAFENYFDFCPVYISYDTNAYKIKNGEPGWFLNSKGMLNPKLEKSQETNHRVVVSNTPGSTASSRQSLVLKQPQNPQLQFPFPYFADFRTTFNVKKLKKQGLIDGQEEKPLSVEAKTVFIWNARLKKYYQRSLGS